MPTFLDLPNEILLDIVHNLQFEDIESVTLSCKLIRNLAREILRRHLARKRRFSTVAVGQIMNLTWDKGAQIRGVHPIIPLRDFILDEESALYARTLVVGYIDSHTLSRDPDHKEGLIADSDLVNIVAQLGDRLLPKILRVTRALRLHVGKSARWARTWISDIVSGSLEAAASLLIALLPNLEKLQIIDADRYYTSPPLYTVLDSILEAAADPKRDLAGLNSFERLVEVDLNGSGDDESPEIEICSGFSALPSIRTIKGRYVDGELRPPEGGFKFGPPVDPFERKSKIKTLVFYQSSIDKKLELGARGIVEVLRWYASKSLLHLDLTGVVDVDRIMFKSGEPFIGTLRAFEVLETLRLETMMLYREVEGTDNRTEGAEITEDDWAGGPYALVEPQRLVDVLPASAKRLRLVGGLSNEEAIAMLADILELKDERIPNFRRIFFEDVDPSSEISSVCEKAGIRAKFCAWV